MSKHVDKVTINKTGTITLYIVERDHWGIFARRQITFDRGEFEQALREAEVTVPWSEATR